MKDLSATQSISIVVSFPSRVRGVESSTMEHRNKSRATFVYECEEME